MHAWKFKLVCFCEFSTQEIIKAVLETWWFHSDKQHVSVKDLHEHELQTLKCHEWQFRRKQSLEEVTIIAQSPTIAP